MRISYRFYQFVTTQYITDFYIINIFKSLTGSEIPLLEGLANSEKPNSGMGILAYIDSPLCGFTFSFPPEKHQCNAGGNIISGRNGYQI